MARSMRRGLAYAAAGFGGCVVVGSAKFAYAQTQEQPAAPAVEVDGKLFARGTRETLQNYSETHRVEAVVHRPESEAELIALLRAAAKEGRRLRVVGSQLSPNGVGLPTDGAEAVNLMNLDRVVSLNKDTMEVTVEAGCTVRALQEYLQDEGLTLENFSSIAEQEIAGWTQVAAHGTGATLPTVEEQITQLRMVTPAGTTHTLDASSPLFPLAKVSLGTLGVLTRVTLRCKKQHKLLETSTVEPLDVLFAKHNDRVRKHLHVKYNLVPGSNEGLVVTADPTDAPVTDNAAAATVTAHRDLWEKVKVPGEREPANVIDYREALLLKAPLDFDHVQAINRADVEAWRSAQGQRVGQSNDILGFACGGHQWVYEVCFPSGSLDKPSNSDVQYMKDLLKAVDAQKIPAPTPIEVRFSGASTTPMSPAYSANPRDVFCWIGIIMYLPSQDPAFRRNVTAAFEAYKTLTEPLQQQHKATPHWAKVELHDTAAHKALAEKHRRALLALREARKETDPHDVLGSKLLDAINKHL